MIIFFDSIQEGHWFQKLHPDLADARLEPFPGNRHQPDYLKGVLELDRPDIVLVDEDRPILVVERTIEVPSGHNVGQRFARLVAAARCGVPVVYFGPYAAYKHGGETQGPRYMNLRLFYALSALADVEQSAVTTVRWPVDDDYEIIQTPEKDARMIAYLEVFFDGYRSQPFDNLSPAIMASDFERDQERERDQFIADSVRSPEQYDAPPNSVDILPTEQLQNDFGIPDKDLLVETVFYNVGMKYIRSDPYTGMGLLYSYLYCGGIDERIRNLFFYFPNITKDMWDVAAAGRPRKDIRLYRLAADAIIFGNSCVFKSDL